MSLAIRCNWGDGHLVKSRLRLKTQLPLLGTGPRVPTRGTRGPRFWPGVLLLLLASPYTSKSGCRLLPLEEFVVLRFRHLPSTFSFASTIRPPRCCLSIIWYFAGRNSPSPSPSPPSEVFGVVLIVVIVVSPLLLCSRRVSLVPPISLAALELRLPL